MGSRIRVAALASPRPLVGCGTPAAIPWAALKSFLLTTRRAVVVLLPTVASLTTPPKLVVRSHTSTSVRADAPRGLPLFAAAAATVVAASCFALFPESCSAASFSEPSLATEPSNALSLPTWAIHVSSVVEWVTAMSLVWDYGEKSDFNSWKGLSWGMVPLLGGALCACTWHFFYNSESLEILVVLQAALTVFGNFTMCFAAYRTYRSSQRGSGNL